MSDMEVKKCPKCGEKMKEESLHMMAVDGMLVDGGSVLSKEGGFFSKKRYPLVLFYCLNCGYVEFHLKREKKKE